MNAIEFLESRVQGYEKRVKDELENLAYSEDLLGDFDIDILANSHFVRLMKPILEEAKQFANVGDYIEAQIKELKKELLRNNRLTFKGLTLLETLKEQCRFKATVKVIDYLETSQKLLGN